MTYCNYCEREVEGEKKYSVLWALFWFIVTIPFYGVIGVLGYTLYWGIKPKRCPICNAKLDTTYKYKGPINENNSN